MPFGPGIPPLESYPTDTLACVGNDRRIKSSIATLPEITRDCKLPECSSTGDRLNKLQNIHTMDYFLNFAAIKENEEDLQILIWETPRYTIR